MEVASPVCKHMHDGQEFMVMDVIITFYIVQAFQVVCDGSPVVVLELAKDGTCSISRAVSFHLERWIINW